MKASRAAEGNSDQEEEHRADSDFRGSEVICFDQLGLRGDARAEKKTGKEIKKQKEKIKFLYQKLDLKKQMKWS